MLTLSNRTVLTLSRAKQDIILPLSGPMRCVDGTYTDSIYVPKGTKVIIANYSANRNKAIWGSDAEEWKPERWVDGNLPQSVLDAKIPGVYANLLVIIATVVKTGELTFAEQNDVFRRWSCMHVRRFLYRRP